MPRVSISIVAIAVATAVLAAGGGHPRAAPAADEELNRKGVEFRKSDDNKAARDVFQQAYDLTHSPRAAAQLGLVNQALGRWEAAEPLVSEALRSPKDPWVRKNRATLDAALQTIKEHVAHIELAGEPAGAEIYVNGTLAGKLPLAAPLAVSTGEVDLELRAPGFRHDIRKLTMTTNQYEHVFVRLQEEPAAARVPSVVAEAAGSTAPGNESAPPSTAPPPPAGSGSSTSPSAVDQAPPFSTRRALKWTSLGLAGAGLGTGIVASIVHSQKVSSFQSADGGGCADDGGRAVDRMTGLPVAACQSLLDSYHTARTWQIIGFSAAGVFAVTWLVLQLTEPSPAGKSVAEISGCSFAVDHPGASCTLIF